MANSTVISRKDMREPDRFQVVATQAASWLAERKKKAAVVGGVAVAAILIIGVIAAIQTSRADAAGSATSSLLATVAAPILAQPETGSTQKSFPSDEAKQRAVVAEADKVLAAHGGSRAAGLAVLVKADALYALKQWDQAGAEYERYLQASPGDDSLRFAALNGLALVAEAKGDPAGAARAYERMAQQAPRYSDRADLERARVLAAAGKPDEARQILGKFAESHKDSMLAQQAAQQLAQLGAK
jgi:tetratricopeptide (TPR) repeat protein